MMSDDLETRCYVIFKDAGPRIELPGLESWLSKLPLVQPSGGSFGLLSSLFYKTRLKTILCSFVELNRLIELMQKKRQLQKCLNVERSQ